MYELYILDGDIALKTNKLCSILVIVFLFSGCSVNGVKSNTPSSAISEQSDTSLLDYENRDVYITPPTNAFESLSFTGEWSRTNTVRACAAYIKITNQRGYLFDFIFEGYYAANSGTLDGTATILDSKKAMYSMHSYDNDEIINITFELRDGLMHVDASDNSFGLGFGHNVFIEGDYTRGNPRYTNENIVNEIFPDEMIKQKMRDLLGNGAYNDMIMVMEMGFDYTQLPEGQLTYSGFVPGIGVGFDLMINEDKIYCLGYCLGQGGYTFYTNDEQYKSSLPDFLQINRDDYELKYIYKKV